MHTQGKCRAAAPLHSSHQLVPPAQRGEGLSLLWSLSFPNGVPLHSSHQLVPPAQRGEGLTLLWSPSCPNGVPLYSSHQLVPPAQRGEVFDSALESNRSRRSPTSLCRKLNCGGVFLNLQARMDDRPHLLTTRECQKNDLLDLAPRKHEQDEPTMTQIGKLGSVSFGSWWCGAENDPRTSPL